MCRVNERVNRSQWVNKLDDACVNDNKHQQIAKLSAHDY